MIDQRRRQATRSSLVGLTQRVLQIVGTLITMPLVLHALGQDGFGIWAAAASIAWMSATVDWGIGTALLTAITRSLARGDATEARRQVAAALRLAVLIGLGEAALGLIIIPLVVPPAAALPYQVAVVGMAFNVPASLGGPLWGGLQRMHMVWVWEAAQSVVTLIALFALTRITADPLWYVAVTFGGLLATNLASLLHAFLRHPELRPNSTDRNAPLAGVLRHGIPYFFLGVATTLAVHSDNIIALSLLGPMAAASMAVAQRACMMALNLLWVLTQPLWPAFTDAAARGNPVWIRRNLVGATIVVSACAIGGCAILIAFGQPLLHWWMGGGLDVAPPILWAMAIWIVVPALGRIPDVVLNALGVIWFQVAVALVYSVLAFSLKVTFAKFWGVAGILAATGLSYGLTHLPAYWWWVGKWMRKISAKPF